MSGHYYNENDPSAAAWLRQLIADKLIPAGDVDTRSIVEVQPDDVRHYTQCHFFAGIGGWALALQLAGWPVDRPIWTGSCPCQPFSDAGQQKGIKDSRHLWPEFHYLIAECDPSDIVGEQVASKLGREWLTGVRADLETLGYAVGAADLCAASVGAPHIRQRLYWMANAGRIGGGPGSGSRRGVEEGERSESGIDIESHGPLGRMADARHAPRRAQHRHAQGERQNRAAADGAGAGARSEAGGLADPQLQRAGPGEQSIQRRPGIGRRGSSDGGEAGRMGIAVGARLERHAGHGDDRDQSRRLNTQSGGSASETGGDGFWSAFGLIPCRDGKARRVEPGTFPLAHGVHGRMGLLRGYGNAIVPPLAAEFIKAAIGISLPSAGRDAGEAKR